jgi:hypothetical protein
VAIYALSSTKIDWKTALKVFVFYDSSRRSLCIEALEGEQKGNVISTVEQVMLKDAEFRVAPRVGGGVIGTIEALWGAELQRDLDNDTLLGLAIGKPFRPLSGSEVRYDPNEASGFVTGPKYDSRSVARAERVALNGPRVFASRIH